MKKNTILTLLFIIPFLAIAQGPWEFTTSSSDYTDWTKSACDQNQTDGIWVLTTNGGNNPNISNVTAGVDAGSNMFAAVTLRLSAGGPSFMRLRFPKTGGFVYKAVALDPSQTDFVTYYIDATNADWTGTVDDIRFQFKDDNGTTGGANHTSTGETIEIDKVEFVNAIPAPQREIYEFNTDGDTEGWGELDATVLVNNGIMTVTPVEDTASKIIQGTYAVDASANAYMHIVYKNNSALNNQLRIQFKHAADGFASFSGTNQTINQSTSGFETLSIDMASASADWTGLTQNFQIVIRDTANDDVTNNGASLGALEIDRIEFNNNMTLSVDALDTNIFSLSPNPAKDKVVVTTNSVIQTVSIFDITGKLVLTNNSLINNEVIVSDLNTGIYIINITFDNGTQLSKKIIKE